MDVLILSPFPHILQWRHLLWMSTTKLMEHHWIFDVSQRRNTWMHYECVEAKWINVNITWMNALSLFSSREACLRWEYLFELEMIFFLWLIILRLNGQMLKFLQYLFCSTVPYMHFYCFWLKCGKSKLRFFLLLHFSVTHAVFTFQVGFQPFKQKDDF